MSTDPRYLGVVAALRSIIRAGEYQPGDRLPTEREMEARFGASRSTIRRALELLRAEGWVDTHPSQGTFVRRRNTLRRRWAPDIPRGGPVTDWHGEPLEGHRMHIYLIEVVQADSELAAWLEVDEGSEVTIRHRVWFVDDEPIQFYDSHFPRDLIRGTPLDGPAGGVHHGSYAALDDLGHRPATFTDVVGARLATPNEAKMLRLGEHTSVLEVHRATREATGRVIEGLRVVGGADRNLFTYENLVIPKDADLT